MQRPGIFGDTDMVVQKQTIWLVSGAALVSCLAATQASAQTVKIGHAAPLSGPMSHWGKDNENGIRLAIEELNAQKLVIGGKPVQFELKSEDDQGDPKQAVVVANQMVDSGVQAMLGHFNSGAAIPAAPIYNKQSIPNLSPATNPGFTELGYNNVFRVLASDADVGAALAQLAVGKLGAKRIAVVDDRTAYGKGSADDFSKRVKALGAEIVAQEFTTDKSVDFSAILTRLKEPENSSLFSKMMIYDGENLKDTDPRAKSYQEYRDYAGVDEGMSGISTRFAYKILSKVFNFDSQEVAANPVHLMYVLEQQIEREQFAAELETKYTGYIKEYLSPRYAEFIGKEIQTAYLESYSEYGQNIFDRYVTYADYWIQDSEYRDTDTGEVFDRNALNAELEKIEKPAGIANAKDFRNEIVNFVLRARANNQGKNPSWTSYEKLRLVIEKKMFSNTEELLPVISFNAKASAEDARKHEDFVTRMESKGYTPKQVRLLCEWYLRVRKSS